ncbi:hypothetical protein BDZ89DRAFT_1135183 [Hymenopellis radicata]|nr:hypothetical protein BDZ89DRAFT_1135183 [Hymenopellis radicata]
MNFVDETTAHSWSYRAALPEQLSTFPSDNGEVLDFRRDPIPAITHHFVFDPSHFNPSRPSTIWYTDEASRRNTDTVRRVCFNCRTGESPSWRRSRLVPGKILCNRCGLYERAHSRARPYSVRQARQVSDVFVLHVIRSYAACRPLISTGLPEEFAVSFLEAL